MKTVVTVLLVLALAAIAGAQVVPSTRIIDRLTGDTQGGWVKIDKNPTSPGHERVYCLKIDGYPAGCDWSDVRPIAPPARISRR